MKCGHNVESASNVTNIPPSLGSDAVIAAARDGLRARSVRRICPLPLISRRYVSRPRQGNHEPTAGQQQASRSTQQPRPKRQFAERTHGERRAYRNNAQAQRCHQCQQTFGGAYHHGCGDRHELGCDPTLAGRVPIGSLGPSDFAENQAAVRAAETEGILQGDVDRHFPRGVGAIIEIALRILVEDIDGWRRDLMMDRQHSQ